MQRMKWHRGRVCHVTSVINRASLHFITVCALGSEGRLKGRQYLKQRAQISVPTPGELQGDKEFGVSAQTWRDWQPTQVTRKMTSQIQCPQLLGMGQRAATAGILKTLPSTAHQWSFPDCSLNSQSAHRGGLPQFHIL